jgi:hypothetical protein
MAERCTPDPSSSRVPVHSALVQKSVTVITNLAGRLSGLDARTNAVDSQVTTVRKMAIHLPEREMSGTDSVDFHGWTNCALVRVISGGSVDFDPKQYACTLTSQSRNN